MMSPFDAKNRIATLLDRLALRILLIAGSIGYFYTLWRRPKESLLAGSALFLLLMLTLWLFERSTLTRRDRALRERIGGLIALEDLLLLPGKEACAQVCRLLCQALDAEMTDDQHITYGGLCWHIRCVQCLPGSSASEGDVLSAHRARIETGAQRCVLASTGSFSPSAMRAAEWVDPPVRLISGQQLCALMGRMHPATDAEIARHAKRRRIPFSFSRIKLLALSPAKLRRYLLCAFLLMVFYLCTGSVFCLLSCLLSFLLAIFCHKENSRVFRL